MEHMKNAVLYETEYWIVILTDNQSILGRCVVDAKSRVGSLSKLTAEEWEDFRKNVVIPLEFTLKQTFGAEMFNWSCLMNNAFNKKIEKPNPHVHFHFLPRYRNPIEFVGETFIDEQFGSYYERTDEKRVSQEVFDKVREEIIKNLD